MKSTEITTAQNNGFLYIGTPLIIFMVWFHWYIREDDPVRNGMIGLMAVCYILCMPMAIYQKIKERRGS